MVYGVDNSRTTGSPDISCKREVGEDGRFMVWGSGCGSATTPLAGTEMKIFYR